MRTARTAVVAGLIVAALALTVSQAAAHVTIPEPAEQGGFSIVTFSVPNERPDASTTKLEVRLPRDHALTFVSVQPKPGWTVETTMRTLDEPVEAFGDQVTEVVDVVTWSGGAVRPGEFETFSLSVGVLPDDVESIAFPAIQTYDSGEEVAWIEEATGSEEPEHPAPILRLVAADDSGTESPDATAADDVSPTTPTHVAADDGTDGTSVAALIVAVFAALLAAAALATARRRPAPRSMPTP